MPLSPQVFTGRAAVAALNKRGNVRGEPTAVTLQSTAEHYTTFGDVITAIIKDLHISEARAKVPANNVTILSSPFEIEPHTLGMQVLASRERSVA